MTKSKLSLKILLLASVLASTASAGLFFSGKEEVQLPSNTTHYEVCFTPHQKCIPLIQRKLATVKDTIRVMAYSFTSKPIADALIDAHKRGVEVVVIADKSQARDKRSQITRLAEEGITVLIDHKPAIAHNKVLILGQESVFLGSYNFSGGAEHRNSENLLFVSNKDLASQYIDNFNRRMGESKPLHVYLKEGKEYRFGR